MRSTRINRKKGPDVFHGVDTRDLKLQGAAVYPFDQYQEISQTDFPDGLCFGLTASLMRRLSVGSYSAVRFYQNPLPSLVLDDAVMLTQKAVEQVREGGDIDRIPFPVKRPYKAVANVSDMSPYLGARTKGATLTYRMKNKDLHTLLFFNKVDGKSVIQDPNRFTIDNLHPASAKKTLADIIKRSDPEEVVVTYDTYETKRRSSL